MDITDIISMFVAFAAFIVSCASYWIARKSFLLSEEQERKREPRFSLYLADNFSKDVNGDRLFVFSFTISNSADSDNAIVGCELKIIFKREDKTIGNLLLQHDKNLVKNLGEGPFSPINVPCHIRAHGAVVGIVLFKLNKDLISQLSSEKYEIIFRDAHNIESTKDVFIVKDISNE